MVLKFRKRVKMAPGVYLNIGKKGVSTTIGPKGFSVNASKKGVYLNTSIPNTGISSRTKLLDGTSQNSQTQPMQERQIRHQNSAKSSLLEWILWFISLLWLGLCYLMFTNSFGFRKWVAIVVAVLPFALYWFWQSRKNRVYDE